MQALVATSSATDLEKMQSLEVGAAATAQLRLTHVLTNGAKGCMNEKPSNPLLVSLSSLSLSLQSCSSIVLFFSVHDSACKPFFSNLL